MLCLDPRNQVIRVLEPSDDSGACHPQAPSGTGPLVGPPGSGRAPPPITPELMCSLLLHPGLQRAGGDLPRDCGPIRPGTNVSWREEGRTGQWPGGGEGLCS